MSLPAAASTSLSDTAVSVSDGVALRPLRDSDSEAVPDGEAVTTPLRMVFSDVVGMRLPMRTSSGPGSDEGAWVASTEMLISCGSWSCVRWSLVLVLLLLLVLDEGQCAAAADVGTGRSPVDRNQMYSPEHTAEYEGGRTRTFWGSDKSGRDDCAQAYAGAKWGRV